MKFRNLFLIALVFMLSLGTAFADFRDERSFRTQLLLSAGSGRSIPHDGFGGLSIGYQISKSFSLNIMELVSPELKNDDDDNSYGYDRRVLDQKGIDTITRDQTSKGALELRITPWNPGFFFSLGVLHQSKEKVDLTYKSRLRIVGDNSYTTDLAASLEYEEWTGPSLGLGFNHIFEKGFSIGFGVNVGLTKAQKPEVTVSGTSVSAADLAIWKEDIEKNEKRHPSIFYFALGYSF
ncbi:MAG: hypothetical protein ACI86H_000503 [bacterium]|jgi:hypothetical protein